MGSAPQFVTTAAALSGVLGVVHMLPIGMIVGGLFGDVPMASVLIWIMTILPQIFAVLALSGLGRYRRTETDINARDRTSLCVAVGVAPAFALLAMVLSIYAFVDPASLPY